MVNIFDKFVKSPAKTFINQSLVQVFMNLNNVMVEFSRTVDIAKVLGSFPVEIQGSGLLLHAEVGAFSDQIYIRPVQGRVFEVKEGEGVIVRARDETFCIMEYQGKRIDVRYHGYTEAS